MNAGAAGALAGRNKARFNARKVYGETEENAEEFEKQKLGQVKNKKKSKFDREMHYFFSDGRFYQLRNVVCYVLFTLSICTDIIIATEFYHQVHTNFAASIIMLDIAGLMYWIWFQQRPRHFYYKPNSKSKEFIFDNADLRVAVEDDDDDKRKQQQQQRNERNRDTIRHPPAVTAETVRKRELSKQPSVPEEDLLIGLDMTRASNQSRNSSMNRDSHSEGSLSFPEKRSDRGSRSSSSSEFDDDFELNEPAPSEHSRDISDIMYGLRDQVSRKSSLVDRNLNHDVLKLDNQNSIMAQTVELQEMRKRDGVAESAMMYAEMARMEQLEKLERERDNKWYYCTTKKDIQLKLRFDTTLSTVQGFITYGVVFSGINAAIQLFYIFRYNNIPRMNRDLLTNVNQLCFLSSLTNFLYNLTLTCDLPYFLEHGGRVFFVLSDFLKYLLFFSVIVLSDTSSKMVFNNWTNGTLAVLVILVVLSMEYPLYLLFTDIGRTRPLQREAALIATIFVQNLAGILIIMLSDLPWGFGFLVGSCLQTNSQMAHMLREWSKNFMVNLKSTHGRPYSKRRKTPRDTEFLANWMISSETGKTKPKERYELDDTRHKVLAFNAALADLTSDRTEGRENRVFQRTLHNLASSQATYTFPTYKYWILPTTFKVARPKWMAQISHLVNGAEVPAPNFGAAHLLFFCVMLFFGIIVRTIGTLLCPLAVHWFVSLGEAESKPFSTVGRSTGWRKEYHATCLGYWVVCLFFAYPLWVYYARHAFLFWHLMDPAAPNCRTGFDIKGRPMYPIIELSAIQAVLEVLKFEHIQESTIYARSDSLVSAAAHASSSILPNIFGGSKKDSSKRSLSKANFNFMTTSHHSWPPVNFEDDSKRLTNAIYNSGATLREMSSLRKRPSDMIYNSGTGSPNDSDEFSPSGQENEDVVFDPKTEGVSPLPLVDRSTVALSSERRRSLSSSIRMRAARAEKAKGNSKAGTLSVVPDGDESEEDLLRRHTIHSPTGDETTDFESSHTFE